MGKVPLGSARRVPLHARRRGRRPSGRPSRRSRRGASRTRAGGRRRRRGPRCTTSGTRRRRRPSRAASTPAASRSRGRRRPSWSSSRSGSCQHTCGFQSRGRSPASSAAGCSAQPMPPAKPGRFRKMQAPSTRRVLSSRPPCGGRSSPALGCPPVLPLLGGEPLGGGQRGVRVVLVDEVGAVAAAPLLELGGAAGEHALAPVAVDAAPRAREERDVEHPRALLVGSSKLTHSWRSAGRGSAGRPSPSRCHNRRGTVTGVCRAERVAGEFDDIRSGSRGSPRSWPTSPSSGSRRASTPVATSCRSTSAG